MAPEAAGGAAKTVKAARGNSNSADGDSREEETTGNDDAREGRVVGPTSEREIRTVAVAGKGENAVVIIGDPSRRGHSTTEVCDASVLKASSAERRGAGSAAMRRGRKALVPRRREGLL